MNREVIRFIDHVLEAGKTVALVTLTESGYNTPGVKGEMMAVLPDGSKIGTIGGGALEAKCIQRCLHALQTDQESFSFEYSLTADQEPGMVCGGQVHGFVNIIKPLNRLYIFGGGHVGKKVYEAALVCGFDPEIIEDREEFINDYPSGALQYTTDFRKTASELSITPHTYIVIVTRGHKHDYQVLKSFLNQYPAYIGMIGSKKKVALTMQQLREEGASEKWLQSLYAPIGLDIDNGAPGEIAIGILAEILAIKNNGALRHCKEKATQ